MTKQRQRRQTNIASGTILFVLAIAITVGLVVTTFVKADETTLRWWAGVATIVALVGIPSAFALGHFGARERIAGMDVALNKVAQAGRAAVDLRGQARRQYSTTAPRPTPPTAPRIDPARIVVTTTASPTGSREIVEV